MAIISFTTTKGKNRGIKRYSVYCMKCLYLWTSNEERPPKCPNCHDNNWDRPATRKKPDGKLLYEIAESHSLVAEGNDE